MRFDICSGTSEIARSITLAQDGNPQSTFDVMIGREVVVVQEGMRILVWNWRTGQATVIVLEHVSTPESMKVNDTPNTILLAPC